MPRQPAKNSSSSDSLSRGSEVVDAVLRDLSDVAERDPRLAESTLAMSALSLAREMDSESSATSKSMCARALLETMNRLLELAPPAREGDGIDDLSARRKKRIAS